MSSLAVVLLALLGLSVAILYAIAPLMLYLIFVRLGETNWLLQRLVDPSAGPAPAPLPEQAPGPAPMFRTLG